MKILSVGISETIVEEGNGSQEYTTDFNLNFRLPVFNNCNDKFIILYIWNNQNILLLSYFFIILRIQLSWNITLGMFSNSFICLHFRI